MLYAKKAGVEIRLGGRQAGAIRHTPLYPREPKRHSTRRHAANVRLVCRRVTASTTTTTKMPLKMSQPKQQCRLRPRQTPRLAHVQRARATACHAATRRHATPRAAAPSMLFFKTPLSPPVLSSHTTCKRHTHYRLSSSRRAVRYATSYKCRHCAGVTQNKTVRHCRLPRVHHGRQVVEREV